MYCIDASVLVNSFIEGEEGGKHSRLFMNQVRVEPLVVILPELALPEVASAISRGTGKASSAIEFTEALREVPNFTFVPIDKEISDKAVEFAAKNGVRGADSIYVAVADIFGLVLVTRDKQQIERCKDLIVVRTPEELIK